jgi:flagellar basal body-associated protein FliL
LWWTEWYWDSFFSEYFGFSLSISFHRCSITWKNEKRKELIIIIIIIIFIAGLHNKRSGCGASVASAAGSFATKASIKLPHVSASECHHQEVILNKAEQGQQAYLRITQNLQLLNKQKPSTTIKTQRNSFIRPRQV